MKTKKAVSPLIASVLLVSMALTIIYIISNWSTGFTAKETKLIQEKGDTDIQCSSAGLAIDNVSYNCTSGKVSLEAYNSGTKDLSNFKIIMLLTNASSYTVNAEPNVTLYSGDMQTFYSSINVTFPLINRIMLKSGICPLTAKSEIEGSKITAYGC